MLNTRTIVAVLVDKTITNTPNHKIIEVGDDVSSMGLGKVIKINFEEQLGTKGISLACNGHLTHFIKKDHIHLITEIDYGVEKEKKRKK